MFFPIIIIIAVKIIDNVVIGITAENLGFFFNDILRNDADKEKMIMFKTEEKGYPIEEHEITTPDGYILSVHRIPYSPLTSNSSSSCRIPVYILHGIFLNSDVWLVNGPGRALGYLLADAGYDVWLGNARGNIHSRGHTKLRTDSYAFWQFSWHHIGMYDNPSVIDYILRKTNQKQLHYIGHSQGTTSYFVMNSLKPEYNEKIRTMHALSPVAYMKDQKSPLFSTPAAFYGLFEAITNVFGFVELFPSSWSIRVLGDFFCTSRNPNRNICGQVVSAIAGDNDKENNMEIFPKILDVVPAGASIYQMLHYCQGVKVEGFRLFDYGRKKNKQMYGQDNPPDYPLENVNASKIFLYVSEGDLVATLPDINRLVQRLNPQPVYVELEDKKFSHLDYVWGIHAKELLYDRVISEIKNFDSDFHC